MISDFRQLKETVMDIEEEETEYRKLHGHRHHKKSNGGSSGSETAEVNAVQKRHFSNMGRPLAQVLEELEKQNLLKPLDSQPMTKYGNPAYYCAFHQAPGHETKRCAHLKHEIHDLIDAGKIPNPEGYRP